MGFDDILAMVQSVQMPLLGAVTPELALFGLSIAFFGFSTAVCAMAVSAANRARDAQADARLMMQTTQDYAVEVRQLSSRVEEFEHAAAAAAQEGLSDRINGVRVGSRYDTEEADVDIAEGDDVTASAEDSDATEASSEDDSVRLADATRAATEPRSLLSSMLRRR